MIERYNQFPDYLKRYIAIKEYGILDEFCGTVKQMARIRLKQAVYLKALGGSLRAYEHVQDDDPLPAFLGATLVELPTSAVLLRLNALLVQGEISPRQYERLTRVVSSAGDAIARALQTDQALLDNYHGIKSAYRLAEKTNDADR